MSEAKALAVLEKMPESEFQAFFAALPERVKMLVRSGMSDWRTVLPAWYVKSLQANVSEEINPDDIPF